MSTATAEAVTTLAEQRKVILRGRTVYHRAQDAMWPESIRKAVAAEAGALWDAIDVWGCILNGLIHPASVDGWEDLAGEDEAHAIAMTRAAGAVAEFTGELIRVFPACGEEGSGQS